MTPDQRLLKDHILTTWTNNHKKSAIGVLTLLVINSESTWSGSLQLRLDMITDGYLSVDQQSLGRILRRFEQLDLITACRYPNSNGGAHRKVFRITHYGRHVLFEYCSSTLRYLETSEFQTMVQRAIQPCRPGSGDCGA